jgi:hypothetical protein
MMLTWWRPIVLGGLVVVSSLQARPARATFHQVMVKEVFAGTPAAPNAQYVVLQAWTEFQNAVANHVVRVFDASGVQIQSFTFAGPVAVSDNQMTMLLATAEAAALFGVAADLTMSSAVIPAAGGKVCWENIDCVAWGTYQAAAADATVGAPVNPDGGIPRCQAIRRRLDGGTPGILDLADDSNDSAQDFEVVDDPLPRNNAGLPASPPPFACPSTKVTIAATIPEATEAGPGAGEFTVTRSDLVGGDTVAYTVSGTAVAGVDYTALPGTVTFGAGELTATIPVTPLDDGDPELPKRVVVALSSGADYVAGTINRARVAVVSDEPLPVVSSEPAGVPALGSVDLALGVADPVTGLTLAWAASCPGAQSDGVFSDPASASPTWRAPRVPGRGNPVTCTITVTLSDGQGVVETASVQQAVSPAGGSGRVPSPSPGSGRPAP